MDVSIVGFEAGSDFRLDRCAEPDSMATLVAEGVDASVLAFFATCA